jgi:glyoxylase-like metal-dependent hydrolase (beta-lactamase superfamily II)
MMPPGGSPRASVATLAILEPAPGVFAYYDGRTGGRLHAAAPNWLDDGAYALGIASYAIVDGDEALLFDSHLSLDHAALLRAHLEGLGVRRFTLVLSHSHDDHVAGNAVFADGEIIAHRLTAEALAAERARYETADPPIRPLVLPNRLYDDDFELIVGRRRVEVRHFSIHSADATVLRLADAGLLFAGDVVEDPVTYVSEASETPLHIAELGRLATLPFAHILPAHGALEVIAAGGYPADLVEITAAYLRRLLAGEGRAGAPLGAFLAADFAAGRLGYFVTYEEVHRLNVAAMAEAFPGA